MKTTTANHRTYACALGLFTATLLVASGASADSKVKTELQEAAAAVGDEVADAVLGLKVKAALLDKLGADGLRVDVSASAGVISLSGEVRQKATAELAKDVAESITGVNSVRATIAVKAPTAEASKGTVERALDKTEAELKDAILETKVKSALIDRLGRTGFAIEVEATDGVVSLAGTVPDRTRRDLALEVARETTGVKRLVDLLELA